MKIDLTQEEAAEVRTAMFDKLREVKSLLNYTIIHPVGEPILKRWMYRKALLTVLLDKLEPDNADCLNCPDHACTVCVDMKKESD